MTNVTPRSATKFLGVLTLLLGAALLPTGAAAGVATAGAVLLDPFDPVPAIQFQHFGGYGCYEGCGGGYNRCGDGCGGYRHRVHYRRDDCDDGCYRARRHHHRDHCDRDCGDDDRYDRDGDRHGDDRGERAGYAPSPPPCPASRCTDSEHWERHWREGDRVGQEWLDRGYRQRTLESGGGPPSWYGHRPDWNDRDDDGPGR